jgi:hypothetical protein
MVFVLNSCLQSPCIKTVKVVKIRKSSFVQSLKKPQPKSGLWQLWQSGFALFTPKVTSRRTVRHSTTTFIVPMPTLYEHCSIALQFVILGAHNLTNYSTSGRRYTTRTVRTVFVCERTRAFILRNTRPFQLRLIGRLTMVVLVHKQEHECPNVKSPETSTH